MSSTLEAPLRQDPADALQDRGVVVDPSGRVRRLAVNSPNRSWLRSFAGALMLIVESRQFGCFDIVGAVDVEHQRQDDAVNLLAQVNQPFQIVAQPCKAGRRPCGAMCRQPVEAGRDVAA